MYDITTLEFKKRYESGDIVCILAQVMAKNAFGKDFNLTHKRPSTIEKFVHCA